jgi:uncharacterized protein (DUF1778 family)
VAAMDDRRKLAATSRDDREASLGYSEEERAQIALRVGELRRSWSRDGSTVPAPGTQHDDHATSGNGPEPIEIQPTAEERTRWETAAQSRGQTLEDFTVSALEAAAADVITLPALGNVTAELIVRVCQALCLHDPNDEQLAGVAESIGIDPQRFAMGVRGERMFTGLQLALIAEATDTTVYWLLTGQERRRATPRHDRRDAETPTTST